LGSLGIKAPGELSKHGILVIQLLLKREDLIKRLYYNSLVFLCAGVFALIAMPEGRELAGEVLDAGIICSSRINHREGK
jgi:hypothetical protein